ncbi:hypothetical protein GCM10027430_00890 [Lysobacter tyrosinilyticus]
MAVSLCAALARDTVAIARPTLDAVSGGHALPASSDIRELLNSPLSYGAQPAFVPRAAHFSVTGAMQAPTRPAPSAPNL